MNKSPRQLPTLMYLGRQRATLCGSTLPGTVSLDFPEDAVKDLDLVNAAALSETIRAFVKEHRITPSDFIMVLSNELVFEKDLRDVAERDRQQASQNFSESVPFSNTSVKVFRTPKGDRFVAMNRTLIEAMKTAFEREAFRVVAIVPELVLSSLGVKGEFSPDTCRLLLKKVDTLKEQSFIDASEIVQARPSSERGFLKNHFALVMILIVMLIMFAVVNGFLLLSRTSRQKDAPVAPPPPSATPTSVPSPTPIASPSASPSEFSVSIQNGSGVAGLAGTLAKTLREIGFTDVAIGNAQSTVSRSTIVVRPDVPEHIRRLVRDEVATVSSNPALQENDELRFDILVTLGATVATVTP